MLLRDKDLCLENSATPCAWKQESWTGSFFVAMLLLLKQAAPLEQHLFAMCNKDCSVERGYMLKSIIYEMMTFSKTFIKMYLFFLSLCLCMNWMIIHDSRWVKYFYFAQKLFISSQMHVCLVILKSYGVNQHKLGLHSKLTRVKWTWIAF